MTCPDCGGQMVLAVIVHPDGSQSPAYQCGQCGYTIK